MPHLPFRLAACWAAFFLTAALHGQTAPAPSSAPVQLDEFEVRSNSATSYISSETMIGTRVATPIKDLPYDVNVVTSEFLKDFDLFELNENVAYVSSFSNLSIGGSFNLRGFSSSFQLRDGFFALGRYPSVSVDRIEIFKGPNAGVYGQSSPGGTVNIISKLPSANPEQDLTVSVGGYATQRAALESAGPVGPNTTYILDLGYYQRDYTQDSAELRSKEAYLAVRQNLSADSSVLLQAEYVDRRQGSPPAAVPEIFDTRLSNFGGGGAYTGGFDLSLENLNQNGPTSYVDRSAGTFTGVYEKRFNDIFSLRAAANDYMARRWDYNQNTPAANESISSTGVVTLTRSSAPTEDIQAQNGGGFQTDFTAHYWLANHTIEARTLGTVDFEDFYQFDYTRTETNPDLAEENWTVNKVITVGSPVSNYVLPFNFNGNSYQTTQEDYNRVSILGEIIHQQFAFFDNRLLLYAGLRHDYVDYMLRQPTQTNAAIRDVHNFASANSPDVGVNYKLLPNLALYASRSNGFSPKAQAENVTTALPPERNYGYDYGIKAGFFDNRLNFTLGGYYIVRRNVAVTVLLDNGTTATEPGGDQLVRGLEFDGSYEVNHDFSVLFGTGHLNPIFTSYGEHAAAVGRPPALVTPNNVYLALRYAFGGSLRGLSTNWGYTFSDKTPANNPDSGLSYSSAGVLTKDTRQWSEMIPGYYLVNGGLRYTFRTGKFSQTIGLNVINLLNRNFINTFALPGDRRTLLVNYTLHH